MQAQERTIERPGEVRTRVASRSERARTRAPGALGMVVATAATLGGLYGALALALNWQ